MKNAKILLLDETRNMRCNKGILAVLSVVLTLGAFPSTKLCELFHLLGKGVVEMPRAPAKKVLRRTAKARDMRLEYTLTAKRVGGVTFYGVTVEMKSGGGAERAELCELSADRALAVGILEAMCRGAVTPCAAEGAAQDMLAEAAMREARFACGE